MDNSQSKNLISATELSRKTGRSRDWITTKFAELPRHDGKLDVFDVLRILAAPTSATVNEAKIAESNVRTEKLQFELDILKRNHVPLEVITEHLDFLIGEIGFVLKKLPDAAADEVRGDMLAIIPKIERWSRNENAKA